MLFISHLPVIGEDNEAARGGVASLAIKQCSLVRGHSIDVGYWQPFTRRRGAAEPGGPPPFGIF
jgi:hypothetical protein